MKKIFKSLVAIGAASLFAAGALAQNQPVSYYYSDFLTQTNLPLNNASPNSALGTSNLVSANYPVTGGYLSVKGITSNDQNATGVAVETVFTIPTTNSAAANIILTIAPVLDEYFTMAHGTNAAFPNVNNTFTFTNAIAPTQVGGVQGAATYAYITNIPAANFQGAKKFKVVSINYAGTNTSITINALRAGFWY